VTRASAAEVLSTSRGEAGAGLASPGKDRDLYAPRGGVFRTALDLGGRVKGGQVVALSRLRLPRTAGTGRRRARSMIGTTRWMCFPV